jgi:hypothetical protein
MTWIRARPLDEIVAACFAASGLLALLLVLLPSIVFVRAPPADPVLVKPSPIEVAPLGSYAAISLRPLFNNGRRRDPPPPAPAPPKPPPPPSADSFHLVGLVLSTAVHLALVQRVRDGQMMRLQEGDMLEGWTVKSVDQSGVQLTGPGAATELTIPNAAQRTGSVTANTAAAALPRQREP